MVDALSSVGGPEPILVAIDGPGGAGKSTLAAALLPSAIVSGDDFYRPMDARRRLSLGPQEGYELYFDWQRLMEEVLDPLVVGQAAQYRRYDWDNGDGLRPGSVEVPPRGLVVVEGVYVTRPQLRGYFNLTVWVDAPRETRLARQRARPGHHSGWIDAWTAAEDWYIENLQPANGADLVVSGASQ